MALQVWLPLNGTLENKGLSNVTVTNNGATVNNNGKIGKCYTYTTTLYMEITNLSFSSLSSCSISFWIKVTAKGSSGWLPFAGLTTSYWIMATTSGTGAFYHGNAGSGQKIYKDGVLSTTPGALNEWHHYVITGVNLSSWTKFYINKYGSGWNFAGLINDVRIYDHALSLKEVKEISKGLILHYKLDGNDIGITIPRNGGLIPDGVELYDYILSSGTLWIDTGWIYNTSNTSKISTKFKVTKLGVRQFIYANYNNNPSASYLNFELNSNNTTRLVSYQDNKTGGAVSTNVDYTSETTISNGVATAQITGNNYSATLSDVRVVNFLGSELIFDDYRHTLAVSQSIIMYYFKIWDNNTLVRNMLPCTYLGEPGMWDTVENKFYRNQGTGLFTLGNKITLKEYEYLLTNATNLSIDTGILLTDNHSIAYDIIFKYKNNRVRRLMGPSGSAGSYFGANSNGKYDRYSSISIGNIDHLYEEFNLITKRIISYINDFKYRDGSITAANSIGHCYIFSLNGITNYTGAGQYFYSGKMVYDGKVIRDFIPVSYNGTPGLWDKVEWKFYGNAGRGSFTLGPAKTVQQDAPIFYDSSGYCNHGSITGTLITNNDSPRYTASCLFNNLKIHADAVPINGDSCTLACWVKLNAYPSERCCNIIGGVYLTVTNNGKLSGYAYGKSPEGYHEGNTTIPLNIWTHIAIVWNSTYIMGYVNGEQDFKIACTGNFSTTSEDRIKKDFGMEKSSSRILNGYMSDVRIYTTALSEDDIKELYNTSAFVTDNGVFAEYELYEDNLSDVKKTGLLETANFYENGAESGYALDTDKTRVASNYIISEDFIEI